MKVLGKTLLEHLVTRLRRAALADGICVATTDEKTDDPIVAECGRLYIPYFRGSENDVLDRYYQAAKFCNAQNIVRITSDCPLIDPQEIDKLIHFYNISECDYASTGLVRTYPRGMDAEIFSFNALEKAHCLARSPADREHVTVYIYQHPEVFRILGLQYESDQSQYRWTVDTQEDFSVVSKIIEKLYPIKNEFSLKDMLEMAVDSEDWIHLNRHIRQKKVGE